MTYFEMLIMTVFDILQYYLLVNKLNHSEFVFSIKELPFLITIIVVNSSISFSMDVKYAYFLNSFSLLCFIWLMYRRELYQIIYMHIISVILVLTVQFTAFIPLNIIVEEVDFSFRTGIIAQFISLFVILCIIRWLPIHTFMNFINQRNNTFRIISISILSLLTGLVFYWYSDIEGLWQNILIISIISICFVIVNVIQINRGLLNVYVQDQMTIYDQYIPIIDELIEEIRIKQHDFDNHITALKVMLELKRDSPLTLDEMSNYLSDMESGFESSNLVKLNNRIVSGFLYSRSKYAKQHNINLQIEIEEYDIITSMKDYELVEVLSILVDNAMEAIDTENSIIIKIINENDCTVFQVSNKHNYVDIGQLNKFFQKGYSTKNKKNRGMGLYKLQKILKKHDTTIDVSNKNIDGNYVVFQVSLPSV